MGLQSILEPIRNRIRMIFNRAIVQLVNDGEPIQLVQISVMKDEVKDGVERYQDYGFTSRPKEGAEAIVGFLNGNKDQGIVLKIDDSRYRLKDLKDGEVAIYNNNSVYIKLTEDGGIVVQTKAGQAVVVNSKDVTINLESGGQFAVAGDNLTVDA